MLQKALVGLSLLSIILSFLLPENSISYFGFSTTLNEIPLMITVVLGGLPLLYRVLRKIFNGDWGADLLAAMAIVTAAFVGEYLAGALIVLMLAGGEALETYAVRKASSALAALAKRTPSVAHRKLPIKIEDIPVNAIQIGDILVVHPHEICPVDGIVSQGHGSMDEAYLTGEPYLVSKAPGAAVLSGAINGDAVLEIVAQKQAQDSRYAKIMQVTAEAEQRRPELRRLGDKLGAYFVLPALAIAGAAWFFTGDSQRFLAVLVVATPCPLLIAIPITIITAISKAAEMGFIIRDPAVLEKLPTCRTAIFDKTGTLTYGKPELVTITTLNGFGEKEVLQLAATLEKYSKHPLASAILKAATAKGVPLLNAEAVSEAPGKGLSGLINGKTILVTHRKKLLAVRPELETLLPERAPGMECIVTINDKIAAVFVFRDVPRADGKRFIEHLGPSHHIQKIMLVSGDNLSEVQYLAEKLGVTEVLASQTPEQKLAVVRAETALAPTLFMGDGINDAPALTAATVGLAFGGQNDVTAEAAGAVLLESTLIKVDELLHLCVAMRKIALQSAIGGMALSLAAMGAAAFGLLPPVKGALLQEAIDVLAILNALRLIWGPPVVSDMAVEKK